MKYFIIILMVIGLSSFASGAGIDVTVNLDNNNGFTSRTPLGGFLTGAMREVTGAEVAMLCSSSIKGSLYKGTFDISSFINLFYYPDDKIVVMGLKGSQIKNIMEKSVGTYPDESSDFLQVSGLKGTFSPSRPSGNRVNDIYIGNKLMNMDSIYTVAVDDKLASGFSGYIVFTRGKIISNNVTLREAMEIYVKSHSSISMPEEAGLKADRD
ncbi:MAG: 5'-nucleotidase [Candidatus Eremiobacterota bacterium]